MGMGLGSGGFGMVRFEMGMELENGTELRLTVCTFAANSMTGTRIRCSSDHSAK